MIKLSIIGLGKMGSAILRGVLNKNLYKKEEILIIVRNEERRDSLIQEGFNSSIDVSDAYKISDLILLSIKPQSFPDALKDSSSYDFKGKCIISIAAGKMVEELTSYFKDATIVRAMPNTPALINMGVTTYCTNDENNEYLSKAKEIFDSIGTSTLIKEDEMDSTLPLNGSMPAYLYLFAKGFIDSAVEKGIDIDSAKKLTCESIKSSAEMILESPDSIETLINNVCSKGGTTIAGLNKLYENEFEKAIRECYDACMNRSIELGRK